MLKKPRFHVGMLLFVGLSFIGCFPKITPYDEKDRFQSKDGIPDYLSMDYWAAHPAKKDPSDTIQKSLSYAEERKDVDVFFLHPTSYTDGKPKDTINALIDDPYINKKTDYTSILYQASVFNEMCNVYAPRYRQAHISMYYEKDSMLARRAFDLAYNDVKKAFLAFIQCTPSDRPFIIASHSQGTTHAMRLLKELVEGTELQHRLVIAYLIGMPVRKTYFNDMQVCRDSSNVGCYVSWRTFQQGYTNEFISLQDTSIAVVNPINWRSDNEIAYRKEHKGAILYNFQKLYKGTHSAQVMGNALYISKPKFLGSFAIRMQNYHAGDYNLFYEDIRQDVKRRIYLYENRQ